jgi:tRNA(adenine34) deaminase
MDDNLLMRRCLELALQAKHRADIAVGSLICNTITGEVICEASEQIPTTTFDITAHAEILAIRKACRMLQQSDLSDYAIVTTAEPCWMCGFAIRSARLNCVVYGQETPMYGSYTSKKHPILAMNEQDELLLSGGQFLFGPPPTIRGGILEDEIKALRRS